MPQNSSANLVLKSLSILLGLFFIFLGLIKIGPFISKELHKDMRKEFVSHARVFPLSETLGFKLPSKWYRRTFGALEICSGLLLAVVPQGPLKRMTNAILVALSLLSVYSHFMSEEARFGEKMATSLVLLFMTTCRMIIDLNQLRKMQREALVDVKQEEVINEEHLKGE